MQLFFSENALPIPFQNEATHSKCITVSCELDTLFQNISHNSFLFWHLNTGWFLNISAEMNKTVSVWTQHMMTLNIVQGVKKNRTIVYNICCCNITFPLDYFFFLWPKHIFFSIVSLVSKPTHILLQIFFILSLLLKKGYIQEIIFWKLFQVNFHGVFSTAHHFGDLGKMPWIIYVVIDTVGCFNCSPFYILFLSRWM